MARKSIPPPPRIGPMEFTNNANQLREDLAKMIRNVKPADMMVPRSRGFQEKAGNRIDMVEPIYGQIEGGIGDLSTCFWMLQRVPDGNDSPIEFLCVAEDTDDTLMALQYTPSVQNALQFKRLADVQMFLRFIREFFSDLPVRPYQYWPVDPQDAFEEARQNAQWNQNMWMQRTGNVVGGL